MQRPHRCSLANPPWGLAIANCRMPTKRGGLDTATPVRCIGGAICDSLIHLRQISEKSKVD